MTFGYVKVRIFLHPDINQFSCHCNKPLRFAPTGHGGSFQRSRSCSRVYGDGLNLPQWLRSDLFQFRLICLKRIEFDYLTWQYFNKEEHAKLDALAKKLRRHIQVRCLTPLIDPVNLSRSFRMFMSSTAQPTPEEREADVKFLQKLLAHHEITASKNVSNLCPISQNARNCLPFAGYR